MFLTTLCDFFLQDVLGNLTAGLLTTATAYALNTLRRRHRLNRATAADTTDTDTTEGERVQ
ncbi:hypothetical protein [Streptomyces sp. NPDC051561]|uniref:hypothetical protein n=1 Tax=Streptomyces sp. NPDC051561 TaxID=3365658 RepID=UPI0037B8EFAD